MFRKGSENGLGMGAFKMASSPPAVWRHEIREVLTLLPIWTQSNYQPRRLINPLPPTISPPDELGNISVSKNQSAPLCILETGIQGPEGEDKERQKRERDEGVGHKRLVHISRTIPSCVNQRLPVKLL